ncbi:MAG: KilA-N domain-containing protein, partial [Kingella oralis]
MSIKTLSFGSTAVSFRQDGFLNATQIAAHFGKLPKDYLKTEQTQQYIAALAESLSERTKILTDKNQLVIIKKGGAEQGTWLHPKLAIHFARWLDPRFAVWCDEQIEQILSGSLKSQTTTDQRTPLRQAVSALVGERGIDYSTAYKMVHQRFGVGSIEEIPLDLLPAAVEYVHRLMLWDAPDAITFSQRELRELATVAYYCAWSNNLLRELAAPLSDLGYAKASTLRTLPNESRFFLRNVHKALLREMPKIAST